LARVAAAAAVVTREPTLPAEGERGTGRAVGDQGAGAVTLLRQSVPCRTWVSWSLRAGLGKQRDAPGVKRAAVGRFVSLDEVSGSLESSLLQRPCDGVTDPRPSFTSDRFWWATAHVAGQPKVFRSTWSGCRNSLAEWRRGMQRPCWADSFQYAGCPPSWYPLCPWCKGLRHPHHNVEKRGLRGMCMILLEVEDSGGVWRCSRSPLQVS